VTLPVAVGTPITWTATSTGGAAPINYEFWINVPGAGWTLAQGYSTSSSLASWTPTVAGTYLIQVWARNSGSAALYDAFGDVVSFQVGTTPLSVTGVSPNVTFPVAVGTPITWTATSTGGAAPISYEFWINVPGAGWTLARGYGTTSSMAPWTPTVAGTYMIQVWAKSSGSTAAYDAFSGVVTFTITP
jgi:hypothetical protein